MFCPFAGPQQITQDELCLNWSLLYIVLRLEDPTLPRELLVSQLLDRGKDSLIHLIYKWTCYMALYQSQS